MENLSENKIIEIAKNTIANIKESDNPYINLRFIDEIFEGCNCKLIEDVKSIVKEDFTGQLSENLFESQSLSPAHHLYNYLYENVVLSKYNEVATFMNYPSASNLKKK